ncbi:hypothetical protein LEP1GSC104_0876 [Leptospira interrogans str. UI 12621]|uniref:Uncharacterized protein n=1 Tax=Leptospira interrogans str. UI 12621 TaxID=1049937 RepID=A0A0F6HE77_LEPIR|nr:hypothetical protein LEP1GSC104_0876 [Leptospira interrogans str. UI 12621]
MPGKIPGFFCAWTLKKGKVREKKNRNDKVYECSYIYGYIPFSGNKLYD